MLCYNRGFGDIPYNFMNWQNLSRRFLSLMLALTALLALASCGGGSSSSSNSTTNTSGFAHRILLQNSYYGTVIIMDADTDLIWPSVISLGSGVNHIAESMDNKLTLMSSPTTNRIYVIDNATEALTTSIAIPSYTDSFSVLADNTTGIAAVRNAPIDNMSSGAVVLLDTTNAAVTSMIPVPLVKYLSLNKARTKVLAFAENSNSVYVIDTANKTATAVPGFDRPVAAVFASDDTKAYILNCGPECGGTAASVTVFDTSNNTLGTNIPVSAATVGLIDGNSLYVAGTANNLGQLDVIDTGSNTRTKTGIAIGNGYHTTMTTASGSNLYIGAQGCTNQTEGCLTIFPTSGTQAMQSPTIGSVYGMQSLPSRNLVYVSIGGELVIYDTTTNAPRPQTQQFDVVGFAGDVKQID
jgi:DNA-binding beta-propeller fold protein YncE